jgi:hypothetical protein
MTIRIYIECHYRSIILLHFKEIEFCRSNTMYIETCDLYARLNRLCCFLILARTSTKMRNGRFYFLRRCIMYNFVCKHKKVIEIIFSPIGLQYFKWIMANQLNLIILVNQQFKKKEFQTLNWLVFIK